MHSWQAVVSWALVASSLLLTLEISSKCCKVAVALVSVILEAALPWFLVRSLFLELDIKDG